MRKILLASATAGMMFALAACSGSDTKGGESGGTAAAGGALTPGEYETKVEITKFEMPGMPESVANQMREQMASQTHKFCVTAENAAQMRDQMIRQAAQAPEGCTVDNKGSGDDINMTMTCSNVGGMQGTSLNSTVTGTPAAMTIVSETTTPAGKQNMEMRVTNTRTGDCTAATPAAPAAAAPAAH